MYLPVSVAFYGHSDAFLHVLVALDVSNLFSYVCLLPAVLEIGCRFTVFLPIASCTPFDPNCRAVGLRTIVPFHCHSNVFLPVSLVHRAHAPVLYTYVVSFGYPKLLHCVSNRLCLTSSFASRSAFCMPTVLTVIHGTSIVVLTSVAVTYCNQSIVLVCFRM